MAIIAIAASSAAAGLAVVVAWISIVVCCCVLRGPSSRPPLDTPPTYKNEKYTNCVEWGGGEGGREGVRDISDLESSAQISGEMLTNNYDSVMFYVRFNYSVHDLCFQVFPAR